MSNDNFAFIHIRPGLFGKEQPVATIAVSTQPEFEFVQTGSNRFAVGFAAQHVKKDVTWNGAMGRAVAQGRAERSAKRVFVHAPAGVSRRDLLVAAVNRVLEAVEAGELFATKQARRALEDTLTRLSQQKFEADSTIHDLEAAE